MTKIKKEAMQMERTFPLEGLYLIVETDYPAEITGLNAGRYQPVEIKNKSTEKFTAN